MRSLAAAPCSSSLPSSSPGSPPSPPMRLVRLCLSPASSPPPGSIATPYATCGCPFSWDGLRQRRWFRRRKSASPAHLECDLLEAGPLASSRRLRSVHRRSLDSPARHGQNRRTSLSSSALCRPNGHRGSRRLFRRRHGSSHAGALPRGRQSRSPLGKRPSHSLRRRHQHPRCRHLRRPRSARLHTAAILVEALVIAVTRVTRIIVLAAVTTLPNALVEVLAAAMAVIILGGPVAVVVLTTTAVTTVLRQSGERCEQQDSGV
jgi:hypothetical protein